jgi:alkanesulfonate monooxygenase SsuD/methylene tetrahydromethanopterin reductase-like flavin-dependent oxidoreductase (luciferase family)
MANVKLSLLMSENVTIWDYNHPRNQIDVAVQAERAGFDAVQFADHVVLGSGSDIDGAPENLRTYMMPGNQPPTFPHPSPIVMLSAVAAATSTLRVIGAASLAPLRHPWLLAKELEIMRAVWAESPVSYHGEFFDFDNIYVEPKAYRPEGPTMWFGGSSMHRRMLDRLVKYGSGLMNVMSPPPGAIESVKRTMEAAGRDISELEFVTGLGGRLPDGPDSLADIDETLAKLGPRIDAGYTTFSIKPCQFVDAAEHLPELLEEFVTKANAIAAER